VTNRAIRASDMDRESVVTILRDAYTEGRLTLDEFDERTSAAYAARTWGDLLDLTADLPVQPVLDTGKPSSGALPALPPVRPEAIPPAMHPRGPRRGLDSRLLPALFIWAVIAAGAGNPFIAGILTVFVIGLLANRWATRR
jgi:hypothetical protein